MNQHASFAQEAAATGQALPLLLLPGTACDARLFAPLLSELGHPDIRIVDLTGAQTTPDMARRVLAEAPPRFSLLGMSLGGIVALEMAAQAPGRIDRLALLDTTPAPDPSANHAVRRAALAEARERGMERYIEASWSRLVSPARAGDAALKALITAMARDAGVEALAEQTEMAIHRADSRPRLAAIAVPTLILAGADEEVCPLSAHEEMARAIPGARYFTIPQAGHFAALENPAAVARHVRDWLAWSDTSTQLSPDQGAMMSDATTTTKTKGAAPAAMTEQVLQVERRDYTELAPTDRPRSQSMEGFDDIYTDIVDYIIRCTTRSGTSAISGSSTRTTRTTACSMAPRGRSTTARTWCATPSSGW